MIGFGRQTTKDNLKLGLKLVVYNVTDISRPRESAKF